MPLILVTGYPSSGKTYRSNQLISYLSSKIANAPSSSSHSRLRIEHISDQTLHIQRSAYESAKSEKDARASLASAVKRALGPDTIVIADAPNYIKGFRYQLYCEAKAARTPSCVVHVGTPVEKCRELNDRLFAASSQSMSSGSDGSNGTVADDHGGYEPELFNNLVFRYEEPNGMNRWDSPLFTVLFDDDSPPYEGIWETMVGSERQAKVVRPNQATVMTPSAPSTALATLEKVTSTITSQISAHTANNPSGDGCLSVDGIDEKLNLPVGMPVSFPQLQRLRREFVALWRAQGSTANVERAGSEFVQFLNSRWEQD